MKTEGLRSLWGTGLTVLIASLILFALFALLPASQVKGAKLATPALEAGFTSNSPRPLGEPAVFTNTTMTTASQVSYAWDFGDGGPVVTGVNPTHLYTQVGLYTVTLTAMEVDAQDVATGTFRVLPPTVHFSTPANSVSEAGGEATIFVTLGATLPYPASVGYATADGTASGEQDYTPVSGRLVFPTGQTTAVFTVPVSDDDVFEGDETVLLGLSDPLSATLGAPSTATLTIQEDDPFLWYLPTVLWTGPTVQFQRGVYTAIESAGAAVVTATLAYPSWSMLAPYTITVDYKTGGGTATPGADYAPVSGTLAFLPGHTALTFTVPLADDGLFEGNETISLTLSNPVSATLGAPPAATLALTDDEAQPAVQFSAAEYRAGEGDTSATITVTLEAVMASPMTVGYATFDRTARAGSDYLAASGVLVFAPGEWMKVFTVPILQDARPERDERVRLLLSNPLGAPLGLLPQSTLVIEDDEPPVLLLPVVVLGL